MHPNPKKRFGSCLSVLLVLALCLSLFAFPAAAVEFADMNPVDDPLVGESFEVDAVIPLASSKEGLDFSVFVPVEGMTAAELTAAIADGKLTVSLDRDAERPYVNEIIYPNQSMGGELEGWLDQAGNSMFTELALAEAELEGAVGVQVSFHAGNYFFSRSWYNPSAAPNADYSAPHANGGAYLDVCGYFNLNVNLDDAPIGNAPVKVTPYITFHTMWEMYKDIEKIAAEGKKNGLYVELLSVGNSTSGRNIPYLIVADEKSSVDNWLSFAELAETKPAEALEKLEKGELDDIRVPVLFSNVHANEVAAADGVMRFASMLVSEKTVPYKTLAGFTEEGKAELATEMGEKGAAGSLAVPDLIADKASYLGFITAENEGQSGALDLEKYYEIEDKEIKISDLLKDVFFILVPEENVDGRTFITRTASNGYDLNRDNSFQTTPETIGMQKLIGSFNPVSFTEFHGRVEAFQCEPCDPPHEPNFEYDLLAEHLIPGGEALGITAVANNDGYNSYVIPQRDYLVYTGEGENTFWADPWDDMSTSYTPQFAMLHGTVAYTVELPAYNDHTTQAVQYGILGQAVYVASEKLSYVKNQTTAYLRGVENFNSDAYELVGQWFCDQNDVEGAEMELFRPEFKGENENGNFYPECYIIPLNAELQSNLQAASDMLVWLTRNDVKVNLTKSAFTYEGVEYPAGTMIVSMYQAKRSVANGALYDGTLIQSWTVLYSEGITSFNETRGFDMITVTEPAEYTEIIKACGETLDYEAALAFAETFTGSFSGIENMDVIIANSSEASTAAVNALLKAGCKVGMVTEGKYKGDFICSYEDYLNVSDFIITATGVEASCIKASLITCAPTVFVTGASAESTAGFLYSSQASNAGWNYDMAALRMMGFNVTEDVAKADALIGCSAVKGDALDAVKAGLPAIVYSRNGVNSLGIEGLTYTALSGAMDCLAYVTYPTETLVNASYIAEGDDVLYGYGLGYFSAVPEGADVLVAIDGSKTPTEGFIPTNTEELKANFEVYLNGSAQGISYAENGMNVVCFANTLTNKLHQRDEYAYISNFIFSSLLGDDYVAADAFDGAAMAWAVENGLVADEALAAADCTRSDAVTFLWKLAGSPAAEAKANFSDVADDADYAAAVDWAYSLNITNGVSATEFAPDKICSRAEIVTLLWRAANEPAAEGENAFEDLTADWYAVAVQWAVNEGILKGTSATTFSPNMNCSYNHILTVLFRAQ